MFFGVIKLLNFSKMFFLFCLKTNEIKFKKFLFSENTMGEAPCPQFYQGFFNAINLK